MADAEDDDLMIDVPSCSASEVSGPSTFYSWKFNHYFEVIQERTYKCGVSYVLALNFVQCMKHNLLKKQLTIVHKSMVLVVKEVEQFKKMEIKKMKVNQVNHEEILCSIILFQL